LALNRWCAAAFIALALTRGPDAWSQIEDSALNLPDNPSPRLQQTAPSATASPTGMGASDSQTPTAQSAAAAPTSESQLKAQEKQRVFGVMATFNTTRNKDALPLTTKEKYQLFFKSASDPWPFLLTAFSAGIDQAQDSFPEYGQGAQGYAKRFGADYTDYFTGNLLGNAVLASLLKEDPRYFQKGTGKISTRFLWAAASTVWCKRDSGSWGPNYANVVGNLMGAAVSNIYYPAADRTVSGTFERGFTVTAEAIVGSEVIEFWPDLVRHHNRKKAQKLAGQNGLTVAQPPAPPTSVAPSPQP
jgi:hypothetical protein